MAEKNPRKKKAGRKAGAARARKAREAQEEARKSGGTTGGEGRAGAPEVPPGTGPEAHRKGEGELPGQARREQPPPTA